jgi:hypothetical protein
MPMTNGITDYDDSSAMTNEKYAYQLRVYHAVGKGVPYHFESIGYSEFSHCVTTSAP